MGRSPSPVLFLDLVSQIKPLGVRRHHDVEDDEVRPLDFERFKGLVTIPAVRTS